MSGARARSLQAASERGRDRARHPVRLPLVAPCPLAAFTVVMTVARGLGLLAVVFTFFNAFVFRVDAVRNPGELSSRSGRGGLERFPFRCSAVLQVRCGWQA